MDIHLRKIKNTTNSSSCPETKMPLQNFIGDLQRRVLPSSRNANTDLKHSRKNKDVKKEVDPQNAMAMKPGKNKLVVHIPESGPNCTDKENAKATKRAFREYEESTFKNRPFDVKRQRKAASGEPKIERSTGLAEIQNIPQPTSREKTHKKHAIITTVKVKTITSGEGSTEKEERSDKVKKPLIKKKRTPNQIPIPLPKPVPKHLQGTDFQLSELSHVISSLFESPPDGVQDLDSNCKDYFKVPQYARDYISYLQERETRYVVNLDYLGDNSEINFSMRAILVDWLIQVQNHLMLQQDTLHVTVALIDNFLHVQSIPLAKLQLLGVTALLIASKFEERFAPQVDKLVHLTDNTYTFDQVIQMEMVVLQVLRFDVHPPVATDYLDRFLMCVPTHDKLRPLCQYILDLGLQDHKCVPILPSQKAAASVCVARMVILDSEAIPNHSEATSDVALTPELRFYSGYMESELYPCMQRYARLLFRAEKSKLKGAMDKYASYSQFASISKWKSLLGSTVVQELAFSDYDISMSTEV